MWFFNSFRMEKLKPCRHCKKKSVFPFRMPYEKWSNSYQKFDGLFNFCIVCICFCLMFLFLLVFQPCETCYSYFALLSALDCDVSFEVFLTMCFHTYVSQSSILSVVLCFALIYGSRFLRLFLLRETKLADNGAKYVCLCGKRNA